MKRLEAAVSNLAALVGEDDSQFVEYVIKLFQGKADNLQSQEETMGRKKKETPSVVPAAVQPADINQAIAEWKQAKETLETAKATERALRNRLVLHFFDSSKLEGTDTVDIGWGYRLRVERELAYNATNKEHETEQLLAAVATVDPGIAASLVRWQPEIAKKAYRDLIPIAEQHPAIKEAMVKAITLKPGMPQLELIPPAAEPVVVENIPA